MNPKLNFIFDKERDLKNIWETANSKSRFMDFSKNMPKKWVEICKDKSFKECHDQLEKELKIIHDSELISYFVECVNKSWKSIEKEYFKRLENITGKKIISNDVIVYITTAGRCPYDYKYEWFFVNYFSSFSQVLATCGHELMHFNFHQFFCNDVEKQIGKDKTSDLKEALTMLLNIEFNDLWFVGDRGYEPHKELRKFIAKEWVKEKDFKKLLEKCIDHIKANAVNKIDTVKINNSLLKLLENLTDKEWNLKVNPDWTVKDVISHLVGWEKEAVKELGQTWKTKKEPWFLKTSDFKEFNKRSVETYKNYSSKELLNEWKKYQKLLDKKIKEIGEDKLRAQPYLFSWVFDEGEDNHYLVHYNQIKKVLGNK